MRRFTGHHIFSFFFRAIERNTTDRRFGIGFYLFFSFCSTIPMTKEKSAFTFQQIFKFIVRIHFSDHTITEIQCFLINIFLDIL